MGGKGSCQIVGNHLGGTTLYVMSFEHMHQTPVFKQSNGWRGGGVGQHVFTRLLYGIAVNTCKYRHQPVWPGRALQGNAHTWSGVGGCTTANRVDNDQNGSLPGFEDAANFFRTNQ